MYFSTMAEHNELGKRGEQLAIDFLVENGYTILEKNFRFLKAEVDIIAKKENTIVAVEVKTRRSNFFGNPQDFVNPKKIKLLVSAMDFFVTEKDLEVPPERRAAEEEPTPVKEEAEEPEVVEEPKKQIRTEKFKGFKKKTTSQNDNKTFKNKNAFRRKKSDDETKGTSKTTQPKDPNYMTVLSKVQESFLEKVLPDDKKSDMIESNQMYMKNWSVNMYIDTTEDIVETFEDKEYKFQKNRILGSRYFQNMVREKYTAKFGDVNVSFNWNRNYPDSYTIRVRG